MIGSDRYIFGLMLFAYDSITLIVNYEENRLSLMCRH